MSNPPPSKSPQDAIRRELYLLTLYRVFEAALLCLVLFSPVGGLMGEPRHALLGRVVAVAYLVAALVLFASGMRCRTPAPGSR